MQGSDGERGQFSGLRAVFVNTTLKKKSEDSHTRLLVNASANIMAREGVDVQKLHMLSHDVPPGVYPDMTDYGWERDDWPQLWQQIEAADILVVATPIWLGEESSVCRVLIERLYAMSGELNAHGQSVFYGKVAGALITGNEDGIKHVAQTLIFAMSHLGYTIPPQADAGWIGEAGPGPSYGDELDDGTRAGFDNDFVARNTTIMSWNLMHMARMLKAGIPNQGNDRNALKDGVKLDHSASD
ncbi:flavodoxin family protein [Profundibacterium mesophilum]|uniref:NADPH-dependent FMN reductase domain containing protein n=1 Tax=Profundibacterium mesophilum KAUST100406-0324 TaxID=1037889 RepID=A0A921NTH7_9RHOB|nr:NAD(P)H-dependent oxidoreductase [Profundibacterium mesophilum]KAF0674876.1 NADPH-dependent FMN reductase domain containing protein [Profundibacterium mesophilum KAUST100406-0324]